MPRRRVIPKAQTFAVLQLDLGEQAKELGLLGVRARKAGLDVVDAEPVESLDDADLLGGGERHSLALHAVAQGRVVELHLCQIDAFLVRGAGEGREARCWRGEPRGREPLGGCGAANSPDCLEQRRARSGSDFTRLLHDVQPLEVLLSPPVQGVLVLGLRAPG